MAPEAVLSKVFNVSERDLSDATSNRSLAAWDSLGHVTLVLELEAAYGVSLSAADTLEMTDLGSLKRVLRRRGAAW